MTMDKEKSRRLPAQPARSLWSITLKSCSLGLTLWSIAGGAAAQSYFPDRPEASFIRQFERGLVSTQAVAGGAMTRQPRWLADEKLLVIESVCDRDAKEVLLAGLKLRFAGHSSDLPYQALKYRANEEWYGSTFWIGNDWARVGKNWQHPGQDTPSIRCWCAPRDGRITLSGRVYKLHLDGDGIRAMVLHNARELWRAELDGKDTRGSEPKLALDVRQGDKLRFVVDQRGTIFCDTTHWDPVIAYAEGEVFQASKAFSPQQDSAGWSYEMARPPQVPASIPPTIYSLDSQLTWRSWTTEDKTPLNLGSTNSLPLFMISDRPDSGLVLGVDSEDAWQFSSAVTANGVLTISLTANTARTGKPPKLLVGAYDGPPSAGVWLVKRIAARSESLERQMKAAGRRLTESLSHKPDYDLLLLAQFEWLLEDRLTPAAGSYASAATNHLERARRLIAELKHDQPTGFLDSETKRLSELAATTEGRTLSLEDWRSLYLQTRLLKRSIIFQNPLLDFNRLLFAKRVQPSYAHLVGQYFGWRQRPGGGLFVLEHPGVSLAARNILEGQLPPGSYLEPCLSFDASQVVFSYVACTGAPPVSTELPVNEAGPDERYFHIYQANVDGTGLRQLTRGCYDDMMPCNLPDGGIAFVSTRRRGYSRCFGPNFSKRWHSYTLHRMDADGGDLRILSLNDVSEWFPSASNSGEILFARWDYIDRDAVTHQNLWSIRPDGSNPLAVWGNATPKPHCTFQAKSIPGSRKIVFIASAHHSITAGPVCVVDPAVDPNSQSAITRITPGPYPEAESDRIDEYYQSPWPLSEKYFLVAYSRDRLIFEGEHLSNPNPDPALGLYVLDAAGNRELIYRDPACGSTSPIPLRPRPVPPVLTSSLALGESTTGEMLITDIYQGLGEVPRGTIKELRLVQIFPKTTWIANEPAIGVAGEENTRAILGTVPVEADGSARFLAPARKAILFQALDQDGFAYQTMRSTTSVQPGERIGCVGCHEHRMSAPTQTRGVPLAMRRAPSRLEPGELGGRPFGFVEVVQPVLDRHCVRCHGGEKTEGNCNLTGNPDRGFTKSYWALCDAREKAPGAKKAAPNAPPLVPRFPQRNQIQMTPPGGQYGARASGLMRLLAAGHEKVQLSALEQRRLAAWIDCNAVFYGAYGPADQALHLPDERINPPR